MRKLLAIAAMCWSTQAFGGVIYNWVNINVNPVTGPLVGSIEFQDDVWMSGSLDTEIRSLPNHFLPADYSPILNVHFANACSTFYYSCLEQFRIFARINWAVAPCGEFNSDPYSCETSINAALPTAPYPLGLDALVLKGGAGLFAGLDLQFGALLTGSMVLNDTATNVSMSSYGPIWTTTHLVADGPDCTSVGYGCEGGTGLWLLDLATIPHPVPEPSSLALLLGGLFFLRRRV